MLKGSPGVLKIRAYIHATSEATSVSLSAFLFWRMSFTASLKQNYDAIVLCGRSASSMAVVSSTP